MYLKCHICVQDVFTQGLIQINAYEEILYTENAYKPQAFRSQFNLKQRTGNCHSNEMHAALALFTFISIVRKLILQSYFAKNSTSAATVIG
jgi:hypothetical protein